MDLVIQNLNHRLGSKVNLGQGMVTAPSTSLPSQRRTVCSRADKIGRHRMLACFYAASQKSTVCLEQPSVSLADVSGLFSVLRLSVVWGAEG